MDEYITVYMSEIKKINCDLWQNKLAEYGVRCEFHPDFDLLNYEGTFQVKMKLCQGYWKNYYPLIDKNFCVFCSVFSKTKIENFEFLQKYSIINLNFKRVNINWQEITFEISEDFDLPSVCFSYFAIMTLTVISNGVLSIWSDSRSKYRWYSKDETIKLFTKRLSKLEKEYRNNPRKQLDYIEFTEWFYKKENDDDFSLEDIY